MLLRHISLTVAVFLALNGTVAIIQPNLFSTPVNAQTPINRNNDKANKAGGWLKELNLTTQQFQQIKQIREKFQPPIQQKRQSIRQIQQELRTLLAGEANQREVLAKYKELKILKEQLSDLEFGSNLAIRQILNVQQRQKLADNMYQQR